MKKTGLLAITLLFISNFNFSSAQTTSEPQMARGYVYLDTDENKRMDDSEKGIPGIMVSNGEEVIATDTNGYWQLPLTEGEGVFVIKPSGYKTATDNYHLPQYYYWHLPYGSPPFDLPGLPPSGPLPSAINFPLYKFEETNQFSMLLFADTQARGLKEVNYISHDVIEECIGSKAAFGITLGDIVADDPALFKEISESTAQIGIP